MYGLHLQSVQLKQGSIHVALFVEVHDCIALGFLLAVSNQGHLGEAISTETVVQKLAQPLLG